MPSPPPNGRSSTVRCLSFGKFAQILDVNFGNARYSGVPHDAVVQRTCEKFRERW